MILSIPLFLLALSYVPLLYGFITTFRKYKKIQHFHLLLASICIFIAIIWFTFDFLGYLFENPRFFDYSIFPYCVLGLSLYILFDVMANEQISPLKTFMFGCLFVVIFYFPLDANFSITLNLFNTFLAISFSYYFISIIKAVPKLLRKNTRKLIFFMVLILISTPLGSNDIVQSNLPGIHLLFFCIGFGGITNEFNKNIWLGYILPIKPIRLMILHSKVGLPIYTFDWPSNHDSVDEILFSGMIHGIRAILNETVQHGNIQEIKLEKGLLILENDFVNSISVILIVTKSSKGLRNALVLFKEKFLQQYGAELSDISNYSKFLSASHLVQECFDFLPDTLVYFNKIETERKK